MKSYWFKKIIVFVLFLGIAVSFASPVLAAEYSFANPLSSADPNEIIAAIIEAVLGMVGALSLVLFIYGGAMWMFSSGNEERAYKAKRIMMWTAVGMVVILASYGILQLVFNTLINASNSAA